MFFRFFADKQKYVPGDSILIDVEVINRSNIEMLLSSVDIDLSINATEFSYPLLGNKSYKSSMQFTIPERVDLSHPYWLNEDATVGMYSVEEQELIGKPENDSAIAGSIRVKIGNQFLSWTVPVVYSYIDPVKGEVIEPLMLLPKVTLSMNTEVMIFADQEPKLLEVKLSAMKKVADGKLSLDLPKGWQASPESYSVPAIDPGEEQVFGFNISPSSRASEGEVQAIFEMGSQRFDRSLEIIDYSHFPLQSVLSLASTKVVKLDLQKKGSLLGYIEGAGDAIPDNLRQLGYKVDLLAKEDIKAEDLKKYDAIVLGIRAFNTV
ncbi:MAG: NEW3 domain-containing protein, partial [Bacteroidota bacterium]